MFDFISQIIIYFLAFLPSFCVSPPLPQQPMDRWAYTYISVSKFTPLAVTGPHGQLASVFITTKKCTKETFCRLKFSQALRPKCH